jgi:hypothetical protein
VLRNVLIWFLYFALAALLGTLYAGLVGLVTYPLRASLISWPVWIGLFWIVLWRFKLVRYAVYFAILPLSILTFEFVRTISHPPLYAFQVMALDRSHYTPGTHVAKKNNSLLLKADGKEGNVTVIHIGEDGFRADPETGIGNPVRCREVLIGDSMIYGSGLPYSGTLRPVLAKLGVDACVFGVTGNSPIDYLATLKFVQDRIDSDAHIAIYVYVYNDFVSLNKYMERWLRGISPSFSVITGLINYYDDWRRTTFIQALLRRSTVAPKTGAPLWHLKIREAEEIKVYWPHDPSHYEPAPPLNREQRATFKLFLQRLRLLVANRSWRVSIVFIPDNDEILTNLAHSPSTFQDLDPRRVEALKICKAHSFHCRDLTAYLYGHVVAEGQNPYLPEDRHFSLFGNRIVAEHYASIAKQNSPAEAPKRNSRLARLNDPSKSK